MPLTIEEKRERARWYRIKKTYGLSREDYEALYRETRGSCPICLREFSETVVPVIDHLHLKGGGGPVRGILCRYCNHKYVGHHKDHELVYRIYLYLRDHPVHYITPLKVPKKRKRKK